MPTYIVIHDERVVERFEAESAADAEGKKSERGDLAIMVGRGLASAVDFEAWPTTFDNPPDRG